MISEIQDWWESHFLQFKSSTKRCLFWELEHCGTSETVAQDWTHLGLLCFFFFVFSSSRKVFFLDPKVMHREISDFSPFCQCRPWAKCARGWNREVRPIRFPLIFLDIRFVCDRIWVVGPNIGHRIECSDMEVRALSAMDLIATFCTWLCCGTGPVTQRVETPGIQNLFLIEVVVLKKSMDWVPGFEGIPIFRQFLLICCCRVIWIRREIWGAIQRYVHQVDRLHLFGNGFIPTLLCVLFSEIIVAFVYSVLSKLFGEINVRWWYRDVGGRSILRRLAEPIGIVDIVRIFRLALILF